MLQSPRTDGLLRCPRGGCDELLGSVRALTFHLHIHAVGAAAYCCVRCGGAFEAARELTRHNCARRRARGASFSLFLRSLLAPCSLPPADLFFSLLPPFLCPIDRLRNVVRAWTCLSSTSQSFERKQQQQQNQYQQLPPSYSKRKDENDYY